MFTDVYRCLLMFTDAVIPVWHGTGTPLAPGVSWECGTILPDAWLMLAMDAPGPAPGPAHSPLAPPTHPPCSLCPLRHLVFCILDLLLELLVPEVSDEGFQSRLLQQLSGNAESSAA